MPVDLHRTGQVARIVQQHILVRFHQDDGGIREVILHPPGGDQHPRIRVRPVFRILVVLDLHFTPWFPFSPSRLPHDTPTDIITFVGEETFARACGMYMPGISDR